MISTASQVVARSVEDDTLKDEVKRIVQNLLALGQAPPDLFREMGDDPLIITCSNEGERCRKWAVTRYRKEGLVVHYSGLGLHDCAKYTTRGVEYVPPASGLKQMRADAEILHQQLCQFVPGLEERVQHFLQA